MKIVFFMQDTGTVFGAERATLDLAGALRKKGWVPCFFLMVEKRMGHAVSGLAKAIEASGFPCMTFPVSGRLSWSAAKAVRKAYGEVNGDVLHVIGYKANLHAVLSGIRPVASTVHGWLFRNDLKERLYGAIDRWCLRRCDAVVCLSTYYEKLLLKFIRRDKLHLIPSGLASMPVRSELAWRGIHVLSSG